MFTNASRLALSIVFLWASPHPRTQTNRPPFKVIGYYSLRAAMAADLSTVPFDKLMQPITHDAKLRRLVRNMVYDGVLSRLL